MKFDLSKVKFSRFDMKRGLKLPTELNEDLAEDIGIMVGDGHVGKFKRPTNKTVDYIIVCSGNAFSDRDYIINHVKKLKLKLFSLDIPISFVGKNKTEIRLKINSKGLLEFYTKIIGLPLNKKENIGIPSIIMDSDNQIKCAFIKGLTDTDFSITFRKKHKNIMYYPLVRIKTVSKRLIIDLKKILNEIGFKPIVSFNLKSIHSLTKKTYVGHELALNGKENLKNWMKIIGSNNLKNILKYNLWKKQGFCPG